MNEAPAVANNPELEPPSRRSFVGALFAVGGAAVSLILAIPLVRFSTFPLRKVAAEGDWSDVGSVTDFASITAPVAKTISIEHRDAWQTQTNQTAVYVLPSKDGQFRILSPVCPHLGCSVRWENEQNKFVCPCHAGSFTPDGERLAGPPPRSMDSLDAKVVDGVLKVRYRYYRQLVATKEEMA
jgi:menaquinol-cytochrome c reductase iron-sulfur subunit